MDPTKSISTLRSIIQTTQHVQHATARRRNANTRNVRQVRRQALVRVESDLQTVVNATRAILGVLDDPLLRPPYPFDDRLKDWLCSTEPNACLDALREMAGAFNVGRRGARAFAGLIPTRSTCDTDGVQAALVLFQAYRAHFHFLLTTDVWNHEHVRVVLPAQVVQTPSGTEEEAHAVEGQEQPQSTIPAADGVVGQWGKDVGCTVSSDP